MVLVMVAMMNEMVGDYREHMLGGGMNFTTSLGG
jgi:hypothetical protein